MVMKICNNSKCPKGNLPLPLTEFNKRGKGYQSYCRGCQKLRAKQYYKINPQYYKDKAKRNHVAVREFVKKAKNYPCADCGIAYPYYVMDFDHLEDKSFGIGRGRQKGMQQVLKEIAKCDVVCANCHRERTHVRVLVDGVTVNTSLSESEIEGSNPSLLANLVVSG